MVFCIVGDLGGTNARIRLICVKDNETEVKGEKKYPSKQYPHLNPVAKEFISEFVGADESKWPACAVFCVAGPVKDQTARITNLKWDLDSREMEKSLKIAKVYLMNDFVGVGFGTLELQENQIVTINDVPAVKNAPIAVIGAGTGLGEAFLTHNGQEYDVYPTEGGHANFAPTNIVELKLMEHIKKAHNIDRVSTERVVSGGGLPDVYDFFAEEFKAERNEKNHKRVKDEKNSVAVMNELAQAKADMICEKTFQTFIGAFGSEAGDLSLKILPFGGLYVAGGMAPKILWAIQRDNAFMSHFVAKGRMRPLLEKIPVHVVMIDEIGMLGCQFMAKRLLKQDKAKL